MSALREEVANDMSRPEQRRYVEVRVTDLVAWPDERIAAWVRGGVQDERARFVAVLDERRHPLAASTPPELLLFLKHECDLMPEALVSSQDLYEAYRSYAIEPILTLRQFGLALSSLGYENAKVGRARRWHWLGIRLRVVP
jgi:hypothetical protein